MIDRVYTNLTITSGNLITNNIQCSAGLTSSNINASNVTIGNLVVTGTTITVNVTEQNVVDTNITTGSLDATGITAGNINFTGNLYQNGAVYSPSASPNYGIYPGTFTGTNNPTNNPTNISSGFGTTTAMSGLVLSSTGWTNTSGSTMVLQISYNFPMVTSNNGNYLGIYITINGNGEYITFYLSSPSSPHTLSSSGIIILNNGAYFSVNSIRSTFNSGNGTLYVNVLH
jgi:hypothetical protein